MWVDVYRCGLADFQRVGDLRERRQLAVQVPRIGMFVSVRVGAVEAATDVLECANCGPVEAEATCVFYRRLIKADATVVATAL